jgi:hypothetical protein
MAATEPLAERIRQEHPHASVHVVESGLGAAWRELADALYMNARSARAEICVGIGDEVELDGALIGRLLPAVLERRPDLIFIVDAEVRRGLEAWGANVVERDESAGGLGTLARASALMLPASSSLWNVTASGIRALEAAYLDCPVLASPLPGWARHGGEGLQWIESEEQWIDALCAVGSAPTASPKTDCLLEQGVSAIHTRRMRECCG